MTDCTSATMKALIKNAERTDMVATNIGNVPIEDYREIVATQNGFDSYEEMYNEGVRIGNGYDKEPEPIVPAWEQKKKSKVKSFDLHPDIPMSERHNFDLANNQVEEVNKKERFHRNYAAIKVLKDCQNENRFATPDEQKILSRYVGWGGFPEAFDERAGAWHTEYAMLKNILTPEEYASARESTLTAFYTPPEVSTAIYKVLEQMGFQEGNLLEPSCGIGNFIGMLPKSMENAKVYGVELDTISAGIAQQLYQKSSIAAQGFEEVNVPDSFFDGVIGNVPFGDFKVSDKRYDKYNFLIHDYFFAKSLDKLRPCGVMALVTSKGTMDKENSNVRKYIAQRAELLGAIRLPNNTFKGNAGTEVVSDILFLQKRDRLIDIVPDWVHLDTDENGIRMNSYFVQHPEMILGEMKMVSGRFGPEATCEPFENADLSELLNEAASNIHGEISEYEVADELEEEDNSIPADPTVRNFSYTVLDDKIYFRENSRMSPVEVSATAENRIKGMIGIRDCVRNLIELQTEDYPDSEIKQAQEKLNTLYDSFTKKYGLINSRANTSAFSDDSSYEMAVSKLWSVTSRLGQVIDYAANPEKTAADIYTEEQYQALRDVLSYAKDEEKTEREFFVEGINCNPATARDQFISVKKAYGKDDGIQAYHGYLSFKEQDISPELAQKIGMEFANEVWGKRFQVVVTTHLNTKHLHCHYVINSVSFVDGKRLWGDEKAWFKFRLVADRLCEKYGLYYNPNPNRSKQSSYYYKQEQAGMPSRYSITRDAIDEAIAHSTNLKTFDYILTQMGYEHCLSDSRKYWTIVPKGYKKPIRLKSLGENYTEDAIKRRLTENQKVLIVPFAKETVRVRQYRLPTREHKIKKVGGLYGLYLHYCYKLGYLPKYKKQNTARLHYLLKEDLLKLDKITQETRLLGRENISTDEQLFSYKESVLSQIKSLTDDRTHLRKQLRRNLSDDELSNVKEQITAITSKLWTLRKEVGLCDDIAERSKVIEANLETVRVYEEKQERKEQNRNDKRR